MSSSEEQLSSSLKSVHKKRVLCYCDKCKGKKYVDLRTKQDHMALPDIGISSKPPNYRLRNMNIKKNLSQNSLVEVQIILKTMILKIIILKTMIPRIIVPMKIVLMRMAPMM